MTEDYLYLEEGVVKVSEMAMQIPEFKDFKRYDTSTNKVFFHKAMAYIYYVYKVFGEEKSYLKNLPLQRRRQQAVKNHTGSYKNISDFEENDWVLKCIESYLLYSRTRPEIMFDTLKEDFDRYLDFVQKIPYSIKKTIKVPYKVLDEDDPDGVQTIVKMFDVQIDVPNTKERIDALKQANDLFDMFNKLQADVIRDGATKKAKNRLFEDKNEVAKIVIGDNEFPTANK